MTTNESLPAEPSHSRPPAYHAGHPWYYLPRGDNLPPLAANEIAPSPCPGFSGRDLPKDEPRREHRLRELLHAEESALADSVTRYEDIVARGADALSRYDREIAYGGDFEMARASSLALLHCHIAYHKGRIDWLKSSLDRYGPMLFS